MCLGNCSYNGQCESGLCYCNVGYILPDCSASLKPGDSLFLSYEAFRWMIMLVSLFLCLISMQRLAVIRKQYEGVLTNHAAVAKRAQMQTIMLVFAASLTEGVVALDAFCAEGIYHNVYITTSFWDVGNGLVLTAASRALYFFISLFARFNPASAGALLVYLCHFLRCAPFCTWSALYFKCSTISWAQA